jgi:periplasmic protein CpxP/Spy
MLRPFAFIIALMISLGVTSAIAPGKLHSILSTAVAQTPIINPQKQSKQGWLKDLNLTSEQLQQIQDIRKISKGDIAQKRQGVQKVKQELETLMANTAPQNEVRKKYQQLKTLRQQLNDAQFENTLAIREVLNPEQRQKYANHMYKNRR